MDEATILERPSVPSPERSHTPSPEFQNTIRRLQKQIPDDGTLQSIQVETLTEHDLSVWNFYLQLIQRLDESLQNNEIILPGQRLLFERILKKIISPTFAEWMKNRIGIITADLDIIDIEPSAKIGLQEYLTHEKRRFT